MISAAETSAKLLCYVMLCYVMLCYVMLCYVMLCYVMLCYFILFYFISFFTNFVQIPLACGTNIFIESMETLRLPLSALAMVAWKSFNGKFNAKIDFPIGYFMLPLLMLTLKV